MKRYSQHQMFKEFNKIYRMFSKKKNKSKYNKYNKINSLLNTNKNENNNKTTIINDLHHDDNVPRKKHQDRSESNDKFQFPWKCYEGFRVSYSFFFSTLNIYVKLRHYNVLTNAENLFKEATMSVFQHKLVKMHQLNSKQSIGIDTINTTDNNSSRDPSNNNTSSKSDVNNDPFPLTFIFESKLAGLYQHTIERYCMNPNLSIHYQLHEIKSSSIYDAELYPGIFVFYSILICYDNYHINCD